MVVRQKKHALSRLPQSWRSTRESLSFGVALSLVALCAGCGKNSKKNQDEATPDSTSEGTAESDDESGSAGSEPESTDPQDSTPTDNSTDDSSPGPDTGEKQVPDGSNNYIIGTGIFEITGEISDTAFFGYAKGELRSIGLLDRQYARAFIVKDPAKMGKSVVFVSIDKGGMFQSTNILVTDALKKKYDGIYNDENLVVSATHTHCAAGGMSHYSIYEVAAGGFFKTNQDALVRGILEAIDRAHNNLAPGRIYMNQGKLKNASINRSMPAYANNKDASDYPSIDEDMTVLRFIQGKDKSVGMLSWFAVHPVNLPNTWKLSSGDNKGFAALSFEAEHQADYGEQSFVGAFAQSNPGDMSPNLNMPGPEDYPEESSGPGASPEKSMQIIGQRQLDVARKLYNEASTQLKGSIDFASRYSDMSKIEVDKSFTNGENNQKTCTAALGNAFAAGAEDGRSEVANLFREGATKDPNTGSELDRCHAEKQVFLITGIDENKPTTPKILPTSLLKIGQFGILAAPSEFTVMAGRRARKTVEAVPNTGITTTVFAGYSDAYAGYVTTREEYATQQYEGGSTHFGPWTLGAFRQQFSKLAQVIADPSLDPWNRPEPKPPRLPAPPDKSKVPGADSKPTDKDFGDVKRDAEESYGHGDVVLVQFWSGHPNHDLQSHTPLLRVQMEQSGRWTDIRLDRTPDTKLSWNKEPLGGLVLTAEWTIPKSIPAGTYRLLHEGKSKAPMSSDLVSYEGASRNFEIK